MYRTAIGLLAGVLPLAAQFNNLVTTDDGEQVYFATSLPLVSRAHSYGVEESRAFRLDAGLLQMFAERASVDMPLGGGPGGVGAIQVSGDGQSVALSMVNVCLTEGCRSTVQRAEVRGRNARVLGEGSVWMSRNGKWALLVPAQFRRPSGDRFGPPVQETEATLIDLETGEGFTTPYPATRGGSPLTSDGAVFAQQQNPVGFGFMLGVWRRGEFQPLTGLRVAFSPIALTDRGNRLIYSTITAPPTMRQQLMIRDLETNADVVVYSGSDGEQLDLLGSSNNGDRILFRVMRGQPYGTPFLWRREAGEARQVILPPGELAAAGTMSGNGNTATVVTSAGRMTRLDTNGQSPSRELIAPTPYVCCSMVRFSPGEVVQLIATLPSNERWDGRLFLNGNPLPVIASDATSVTVQAPWDLRTGTGSLVVISAGSPFSSEQSVILTPVAPRFLPGDPQSGAVLPGLKIIRGDFGGYQTTQPGPGDVVHVYLAGLGAVRGAVQTGVPAPLDDLRPIAATMTCRFLPHATNAETLFAGLAPGLLGVYQVTLRLPSEAGAERLLGLQCQVTGNGFSAGMTHFGLPPTLP